MQPFIVPPAIITGRGSPKMACGCSIIPHDVLTRFASDTGLPTTLRQSMLHSAQLGTHFRALREQFNALSQTAFSLPLARPPVPRPHVLPPGQVYDCHHSMSLPGAPVANPGSSADATAKRAYDESEAVAKFYWDVFQRDSIDGHHMTLISSIHYSEHFNNAFWNGSQMTYGDGDGQVFVDFTLGDDVIGHELTHGVTQHSLGLNYSGEAGGLNESNSDVFGSMFRQWEKDQTVAQADWLIGADIMGPVAKQKGYTCLRDMANAEGPACAGGAARSLLSGHRESRSRIIRVARLTLPSARRPRRSAGTAGRRPDRSGIRL